MTAMRGIDTLTDRRGRKRYRVRVRGYSPGEDRPARDFNGRFDTLAEAVAFRDAALGSLAGQNEPPAPPAPATRPALGRAVTVEDAARRLARGMRDGTLRNRNGQVWKPSVTRRYEESLRTLVLPVIGAVPVAALTTGDVQRLVDGIATERSAEHARKALLALRVALRVAVRYQEIGVNPCTGVRCPVNADGEKPAAVLTPEQVESIIAAAEADDVRLKRSFAAPLFALLAGTGLRSGEAYALAWGPEGLDLEAGLVHVRRALDREKDDAGRFAFITPKSRAGRRDVPIPPEEIARLKRYRLATGRRDGELVFADENSAPLNPARPHHAFKRCAEAAGFSEPLPHLHELRHAYASYALAAGLSAHAVARLLGHSDASLVWKRYGHALPSELASAGDVLSAWRATRG